MHRLVIATAAAHCLIVGMVLAGDEQQIRFADCPAIVRNTIQAEAKSAKVETVTREKGEDDGTIFWADVTVRGKAYVIGVLEDGTLTEMSLAVGDEEVPLDRCPRAVQAAFRSEAMGEAITSVGKDLKYGIIVYQAAIHHRGRSYEIVVAEDGTLVEKVLVIDDEEVELADCPTAVQAALREHAKGGTIGEITRSVGISGATFEAELEIKSKVYLVEIAQNGTLIAKTLEAGEE
jgi:hypothetical protein